MLPTAGSHADFERIHADLGSEVADRLGSTAAIEHPWREPRGGAVADRQKTSTVLLQGDDFDNETSWFWWWLDDIEAGPTLGFLNANARDPLLDELERALPTPLPRESQAAALARALSGALATPSTERELSTRLGRAFLSAELISQIYQRIDAGFEVALHITPSPKLVRVPWLLLVAPPIAGREHAPLRRLGELVTIVDEVPASFHVGRARFASELPSPARVAAVVDPDLGIPGTRLLTDEQHALLAPGSGLQPGTRIDAQMLSEELRRDPPPHALLLAGHVTNGKLAGTGTSFMLSPLQAAHPHIPPSASAGQLSAADLVLGSRPSGGPLGAELWPMPARVAIIACSSGADLARREPFGLVISTLNAGARWAVATRWVLPADQAFRESPQLGPGDPQPFFEVVEAAREALIARDGTMWLSRHLRARIRAWEATGDDLEPRLRAARSPLTWGALAVFQADQRLPTPR